MNNEQRMESPKTNNYYKLGKSNMGKENAYIIVIDHWEKLRKLKISLRDGR